jgi:hypothetical protein
MHRFGVLVSGVGQVVGVAMVAAVVFTACGHGGAKLDSRLDACTGGNADPGACIAVARERLAREDVAGARDYMDRAVAAINASPACLRDHAAEGCFRGVVTLLRERPVGLLSRYDVSTELLELVPRWTGSEAIGRRMQARVALHGMCVVPGRDPIEQQRACIVLGDLVEHERTLRCGPSCDPAAAHESLAGWSTRDVIDGYAAACKVDRGAVDPKRHAAFVEEVTMAYKVRADDAVCAVAGSAMRGASIPDAVASMARIRQDLRQRDASAAHAAQREAQRKTELDKSQAIAAAAAAKAEQAQFRAAMFDTIRRTDWPLTFGHLTRYRGVPIDDAVASALHANWDSFAAWAIGESTIVGAYLDLSSRLASVPTGHRIRGSLESLRERASVAAKTAARKASGKGGAWLHAAIRARIAGPKTAEAFAASERYEKLVAATRTALVVDNLAPACAPLFKASAGRRTVRAKSSLQCVVEPERRFTTQEPFQLKQTVIDGTGAQSEVEQETTVDVTHRAFKIVLRGTLTITRGAPARTIPLEFAAIVDDTDDSDLRTFDAERAAVVDMIYKATVGELDAAEAAKHLAAGTKAMAQNRNAVAENHLVTHAVLAGASGELDLLLASYGVTFMELVDASQ